MIPLSNGYPFFVAAIEWATQKMGELDKKCTAYISSTSPTTDSDSNPSAWVSPDEVVQFRERIMKHKS